MYARFYKKRYGNIKTVHTIHGIHYLNSGNLLRKYLSLSIEQHLVPFTDKFICVSEADLKKAVENKIADKEKSIIINNGISRIQFKIDKKNQVIEPELIVF